MINIKVLRKMSEDIDGKNSTLKESHNYKKLRKLEILLEGSKRIINFLRKLRKRYYEKLTKLKLQLMKTKKLKAKLDNKIKKLKHYKRNVHKSIRKRKQINLLVRKKRLERLKLMGELRESDQKRYLKELKAQRKRKQSFKKRAKRIHPKIKNLEEKLQKSMQKLELVRKDMKLLKLRISRVKKRKNSLGIHKLNKKIKKILKQLKLIKQNKAAVLKETLSPKIFVQQKPIACQETLATKITEFKPERKAQLQSSLHSRDPIKELDSTKSLDGTSVSYNRLLELSTSLVIQPKKAINEPIPIGDKQTEYFKDTIRDYKNKAVKLSRKNYKLKEPLPIGDKRDEDQGKTKRFSRYSKRRSSNPKKSSRTSTSSDSNRKSDISKYEKSTNSDSDGKSHLVALPPTPPKRRSLRSMKFKTWSLSNISKNSSTDAETSQFVDKSKKQKLIRVEQFPVNIEAMRSSYKKYYKPKMRLRTHLYKKPIDKRTLQSISVPEIRRELTLLPKSSLKKEAAIHISDEDYNDKNRSDQQTELETNIFLYKVNEKKILHSTHPPKANKSLPEIVKKPSEIYENFYQKLVRLHRPSIREKINSERRKMLELQRQQKEAEEAEKRARENIESQAMLGRSSTLQEIESDQLENLVQLGLKSTYNSTDIVPSDIAVIDDYILEMSTKKERVNIRDLLSATKIKEPTLKKSLKETTRKTTRKIKTGKKSLKKTISTTSKKGNENLKKKVKTRVSIAIEEENESDKVSQVTVKDLYNYNDNIPITDDFKDEKLQLLQDDQSITVDKSKTIKKKKRRDRTRKKKLWSKCTETTAASDKIERIVKIVCSICGMTDMQPGGPCCPLIPETT